MSVVIKEKIIEIKQSTKVDVKPEIDKQGRAYATGKRKNAVAKVWIKKGTGKINVNDHEALAYFGREILFNVVNAPLKITKNDSKFDITAQIVGGGKSGQAGALAHGISKALVAFDHGNHQTLRSLGFLTRDSRVVEPKKYGYKKARKGKTYRKR